MAMRKNNEISFPVTRGASTNDLKQEISHLKKHIAQIYGILGMAEFPCDNHSTKRKSLLHVAAERNMPDVIEHILKNSRVNPNEKIKGLGIGLQYSTQWVGCGECSTRVKYVSHASCKKVNYNKQPLSLAIKNNNIEAARALLKNRKTIIHIKDLDLAIKRNYINMAKLLMSHLDPKDMQNQLFLAINYGNFEIMKALLEKGVNPNAHAMILAVEKGNKEIIESLLLHNADPNAVYKNKSALLTAIERNDPQAAYLLLDYGANPNLFLETRKKNKIPLIEAIEKNNTEIFNLLISYGAITSNMAKKNPFSKKEINVTLEIAAKFGNMEIIKHLAQKANIEVSKQAVKKAKKYNHTQAEKYLELMLPEKKTKTRKDCYKDLPEIDLYEEAQDTKKETSEQNLGYSVTFKCKIGKSCNPVVRKNIRAIIEEHVNRSLFTCIEGEDKQYYLFKIIGNYKLTKKKKDVITNLLQKHAHSL